MLIEVRPADRGRFEAWTAGRLLCVSRTPFCAAARVLQGEGCSPATVLEMQHIGSNIIALTAELGVAARLTVVEEHKASFVAWKAHYRAP